MARPSIALLLLLVVAVSSGTVSAQEVAIKPIPAYGEAFHTVVSPDGRWAATFENGAIHADEIFFEYLPVRVYELETGEDALTLNGLTTYASDVAFSPDSEMLAAYVPTGYLYLWSLDDGELVKTLSVLPGGGDIEFVLDGQAITVVESQPAVVQVWDIESGAMTNALMNRYETMAEMREALSAGPPDGYSRVAAVPGGNMVYVATVYDNIDAWNVETQEGARVVSSSETLPNLSIRTMVVAPDGQSLVYLHTREDTLNILDSFTHALRQFPAPDAAGSAIDVSPDGTTAAWLSEQDEQTELVLTALGSGSEQRIPVELEDVRLNTPLTSLAFLPDGRSVLLSAPQLGDPGNALYLVRW